MKKTKHETAVDNWLRENGISQRDFEQLDLHLLQAQRIANNTLKHHANLLGQNEAATLNNYLRAMSTSARKKLTIKQATTVMNIGASVNRKLFKERRQLSRQ